MSDNIIVSSNRALKPIFAVTHNELRNYVCPSCDDVMTAGAVECHNGHLVCVQCAMRSAPKAFGIRDLILRSSVDQVLAWRGFRCCVCDLKGMLRRSLVTDAAVAALPVRCGFTTTAFNGACRWTGRYDQFDTHQHAFNDPDQQQLSTQDHPPMRGTKRPNSSSDRDSDEDAKQRRREQTPNNGEKPDVELEFQTIRTVVPRAVPESAIPDINATGESIFGLVRDLEVPHFIRAQQEDVYIGQGNQSNEDIREAAGNIYDDVQRGSGLFFPVETGQNEEANCDDAGLFSINEDEEGDAAIGIIENADQEGDFDIAGNDPDAAFPANATAVTSSYQASGKTDLSLIEPGDFQSVESALQEAGLIPKPTVSPVDKAAQMIYDVTASAVRRVANMLKFHS